jgi:hypothetical protein
MTFRYSVGLQNVGSYQVSGRPFLKDLTLTAGQKTLVEFPNVTNKIKICNDHNGTGHELEVMFCEPRRAIDMSNSSTSSDYYLASITPTFAFSTSMWIKLDPSLAVASTRYISIEGPDAELRVQMNSAPNDIRFVLFDKAGVPNLLGLDTHTQTLTQGQWLHMAITVSESGDFKLYFDGIEVAAFNYNHVAAGRNFDSLLFGDNNNLTFEGFYDQLSLFSSDLTAQEVAQLYNNGNYYDPRKLESDASLLSFWDFEDNNYKNFYSTADTAGTINDRVGSSNLVFQGVNIPTFVDGRLIENAEARHKITLSGQEQITLSAKCKQIFLHALNNLEVGIDAPLTGIPANRMFELTGPGIDE